MLKKLLRHPTFRYGIREVTLIVIGILIALSINNWNEQRKIRRFERKILAEIKQALQHDIKYHIDGRIERYGDIRHATTCLRDHFSQNLPSHDSLNVHFNRLGWLVLFEPRTAPFETLRSKGVEIIHDDKLRLALLSLYDYSYPRMEWLLDAYNEWSKAHYEPYAMEHFQFQDTTGTIYNGAQRPVDYAALLQDHRFMNILLEKQRIAKEMESRMERLKRRIGEVIALIEG